MKSLSLSSSQHPLSKRRAVSQSAEQISRLEEAPGRMRPRLRIMIDPLAQAFPTPAPSTSSGQALRRVREGRATHCVGEVGEIKSLGHPSVRQSGSCRPRDSANTSISQVCYRTSLMLPRKRARLPSCHRRSNACGRQELGGNLPAPHAFRPRRLYIDKRL